jgi:serine/threonine-protein kinase
LRFTLAQARIDALLFPTFLLPSRLLMAALTPVESVAALLRAVEKSNLLSAEALTKARETAAALTDPKSVARALNKDGTFTRWQADQLLHGFHRLIVGKYKLLDQLETSPTGRVYLAEHVQMGRRHALKVLAKRLEKHPDAVARFLKGAQNACGLDHRNISHVYDVSQDRLGHYVVMEYVEGQNLEQLIEKRGPLKLPQALETIWQVADGLAYAHSHGVVHGDLKPANLVRDSYGVVKILEIGQDGAGARPETDDADEDVEMASLAAVIFQAPEIRGGGEAADIACDMYSLGSVLTFLLTGKAAQNAATAAAHLAANKSIPGVIVDLCRTLMADRPTDRPRSMDVIFGSIQSALVQTANASQPVTAIEPGAGNKMRDKKEAADEIPAAPPVAVRILAGMPVIAIDEPAPPVVPPPPAELVIQTHDRVGQRPGGSAVKKSPLAGRWSVAALMTRFSPLVIAGAIGGAIVFAFGIGTIAALLMAGNRSVKPSTNGATLATQAAQRSVVETVASEQQANPVVSDASQDTTVAAPPVQTDASPQSLARPPAEASAPPSAPPANAAAIAASPPHVVVATPSVETKTEAGDAPATVVAAAPPKPQPAADSPVTKKSSGDPFKGLPKSISLPPLPELDSSPTVSLKPVSLGPCNVDSETPITIGLLGGETASRATRQKFELQPRAMSPREWDIQLTGNGELAAIAALSVKNGELLFQWTEEAAKQSLVVRQLMNCALEIGKSKQTLALRTPQKGQPLVIDIEKPSASVKWTLSNLPLAKQIFLDVTRTEGFPKLRQDPKGPTNVGDTLTIGTGPAEKSIPLFFKLNTSSAAAAIDVRSQVAVKVESSGEPRPYRRKDLMASQFQYQQELGRLRGELRKAKDSRPRADAEKEAREAMITRLANEDTALNTTLDQLRFILDFAGTTEGAAKIHFRVYFLAGEAKIDLLKTEDDEDAR